MVGRFATDAYGLAAATDGWSVVSVQLSGLLIVFHKLFFKFYCFGLAVDDGHIHFVVALAGSWCEVV